MLSLSAQVLELLPVAILVCDVEGRIVQYNSRAVELFGRRPDERDRFCAMEKVFLCDGTSVPHSQLPMVLAVREGRSFRDLEAYAIRTDGQTRHMLVNIDPIRDEWGQVVGVINAVQDITAMRRNERVFETIFQQSAIGIALISPDWTLRDINPCLCQILGYNKIEMFGKQYWEFLHPADVANAQEGVASLQAGEVSSYSAERRYVRKDGEVVTCRITASITKEFSADSATTILTVEDVTEEKRALAVLGKTERLVRRLVDAKMIGVLLWDMSGRIHDANDTFLHMLGYTREELEQGKIRVQDFTPPEYRTKDLAALHRLMTTGSCPPHESVHLRKDGTPVSVLVGLGLMDQPGRGVAWVLDISRQKELEAQLLQTQKMEAVGQLAGGIAHDFNNILMAISSHAELLLTILPGNPQVGKTAATIVSATERAGQLIRKLLAFSRKQELSVTTFDLNSLLAGSAELVSHLLPKFIDFQVERPVEPCWVKADPALMEQVLVNLVLNARDAMPQGGTLVVRASGVVVGEEDLGLHGAVPVGQYGLISVADTGQGIPKEIQSRIFEPFFTTKPKERGTGLGLAMVYGTVTQTGGHIRVKSSVNAGTTFSVYLPATTMPTLEHMEATPCLLFSDPLPCPMLGSVLVVDDEDMVRSSIRTFLEARGLTVVDTANAHEALRIGLELGDHLTTLITDVVMPDMSGPELARTLLAKRPNLNLVFMSGYAAGAARQKDFPTAKFLQKPFTRVMLLGAVCANNVCGNKTRALHSEVLVELGGWVRPECV